jgi:ribosomal protein L27
MKADLDALGSALSAYDGVDAGADNTIFAIFDACVRRATGKPSRLSSMRFEARQKKDGKPITRMLLA